jgi:hypothetical protein
MLRIAPLILVAALVSQAAAQAPSSSQPPITFETSKPFIELNEEGGAAKLLYTIPEPTSYPGRFFLTLDDVQSFNPTAYQELEESQEFCRKETNLKNLLKTRPAGVFLPYSVRINPTAPPATGSAAAVPAKPGAEASDTGYLPLYGARLVTRKSLFGTLSSQLIPCGPRQPPSVARLMIVESYRLTSFAGDYGAGRTIKTFTLFPGEKTTVTVKTYQRRTETRQQASSILDSFTQESADAFEQAVSAEHSDKQAYSESQEYKADAHAEGNLGVGKASVNASAALSMNASREEFSKNIRNAVNKHSNSASSKRDVSVTSSTEVTQESGDESETQRQVENINVSRTLNLVFRQMNQQFVSVLHLADIRVGYYRRTFKDSIATTVYKEVPLTELRPFLREVVTTDASRDQFLKALKVHLEGLRDYTGAAPKDFVTALDAQTWQINPAFKSTYKDPITEKVIPREVPGVVMTGSTNVLRTDAVIVEAVLGQGNALDAYSIGLQDQAVRLKKFGNDKEELRLKIINDKDTERAKLFEQLFREPLGPRPSKPAP